ncbi:putative up-regulator of cell proliferation [Triplophysa rosa]|uniref:Up-regulator of cell proliferation n=1 Tax=Triplophysa rosa TaxID=992332 RepID=A0A9W7W9J6_TRIRA|nr:putative up-regulator of cell proliferation [Triplophysa rosa]
MEGTRRCLSAEQLMGRLHLESKYQKLKTADFIQITEHSQSHEFCAEEEVARTFLQKLLTLDYTVRCIKIGEYTEQNDTQQRCNKLSTRDAFNYIFGETAESDDETNTPDAIDLMDAQMAVFHCADSFLKQLMVTKLSQCQFALPLLVPNPFTQQIDFPLWTFRQIKKSWKTTDDTGQTQPVYRAETPMVAFFSFGSLSSSKSQLINSLINEKHNTFFHRNCPGSSRTRILMDGVVEIAWYCPSGEKTDKFPQCVAFCNLHAICTNTMENHPGDHSVPFHRSTGLNGRFNKEKTNLTNCFCTTEVASDNWFYSNDSDEKTFWKEYRKGGPELVNWSITPDLSELPYWKWVVCRFQKDLEKHYSKTFKAHCEIPDEWRQYTKEDAIESLDKYI